MEPSLDLLNNSLKYLIDFLITICGNFPEPIVASQMPEMFKNHVHYSIIISNLFPFGCWFGYRQTTESNQRTFDNNSKIWKNTDNKRLLSVVEKHLQVVRVFCTITIKTNFQ